MCKVESHESLWLYALGFSRFTFRLHLLLIMRFSTEFAIRSSYEPGPDGSLQHAHIVRMALEAGYLVTEALGMGYRWFEEKGFIFVVYGIKTEFVALTRSNERIRVETWLSQAKRVRGQREIAFTSAEDGRVIANVQLDWVFVDRKTLAPARMPPEVVEKFPIDPTHACQPYSPSPNGALVGEAHIWQHRVEYREIDILEHVNTAVYLEWFAQAWSDATGRLPNQVQRQHCVFNKSALYGDTVYVRTQAIDNGTWRQEVRQVATDEVLVTNMLRG